MQPGANRPVCTHAQPRQALHETVLAVCGSVSVDSSGCSSFSGVGCARLSQFHGPLSTQVGAWGQRLRLAVRLVVRELKSSGTWLVVLRAAVLGLSKIGFIMFTVSI